MKAKAFERFLRGGDRAAIIADMEEIGATRSTANSWLHAFRVLTRSMRAMEKTQGAAGGDKG
jgi:hypothetical protein